MLTTPCIPSRNKPNAATGYAQTRIDGRRVGEHVAAWEAVNGPVPPGLVLDHLCHDPETCPSPGPTCPHRSCRNAEHLTPVTRGDNARRAHQHQAAKTECPAGHPYDEANTYRDPRGRRHCRTCQRGHIAAHKARAKAGAR